MTVRLRCLSPRPMASQRLLCIPFAGAGATAFRGWAERLPAHIEAFAVQLPGREDLWKEPPLTGWPATIDALAAGVARLHRQPTAIFGHSLGAALGFELARRMELTGSAPLLHLFVSARPWPGAWNDPPTTWPPDDDALLAALAQRYGALHPSLAHPEIRDVVLPALRADLALLADYRYRPAPPLCAGLTVFDGTSDPGTDDDSLAGWASESTAPADRQSFDGGHFFIESHQREVVDAVVSRLPWPAPVW